MGHTGLARKKLGAQHTVMEGQGPGVYWQDEVTVLQLDGANMQEMGMRAGPWTLALQVQWPGAIPCVPLPAASGQRWLGQQNPSFFGDPLLREEAYVGAWCIELALGAVRKRWYADLYSGTWQLPPADAITVSAVLNQARDEIPPLELDVMACAVPGAPTGAVQPWWYTYQGIWNNPAINTQVVGQVLVPPFATAVTVDAAKNQAGVASGTNELGIYAFAPFSGVTTGEYSLTRHTPIGLARAMPSLAYAFWCFQNAATEGAEVYPLVRFEVSP